MLVAGRALAGFRKQEHGYQTRINLVPRFERERQGQTVERLAAMIPSISAGSTMKATSCDYVKTAPWKARLTRDVLLRPDQARVVPFNFTYLALRR